MQRRVFLLLGLLVAMPVLAQANVISLQGSGALLAETPGQVITLLLSGSDEYSSSDLATQINGGVGPAPFVTHVFGDTGGAIAPSSLFSGSIWAGGSAGITGTPNGTQSTGDTGLVTGGGFATPSFFPQTTNGIYVQLTLSTVGVPGGSYPLTFAGTIMTRTDPDTFEDTPVPLQFEPITLTVPVVPEPSSIVLGLFAAAGMAAVVIRRRRSA